MNGYAFWIPVPDLIIHNTLLRLEFQAATRDDSCRSPACKGIRPNGPAVSQSGSQNERYNMYKQISMKWVRLSHEVVKTRLRTLRPDSYRSTQTS
jgi:hypothetical protein